MKSVNPFIVAALLVALPSITQAGSDDMAEVLKLLNNLKNRVEQLESENLKLKAEQALSNEKIEATGDMVAVVASSTTPPRVTEKKVDIGGYGELHYNNLDSKKEIDFHRFVLYFGHDFNHTTRFFSELELEHSIAGEGEEGEIELEQAYIEHDLNDTTSIKSGLFLIPTGIINETHEPPTFYGVERNPVERNIVPSTWWEAGVALSKNFGNGFSTDLALTSGLNTPIDGSKAYLIRSGRQKVSRANASDPALTARLRWTGKPGVELSGSVNHQSDLTQGAEDISATMIEFHASLSKGPFGLKALYAGWDLDGAGPVAVGRDKQNGFYIEPSYKVSDKFGLFARHSRYDNNAGNSIDTEITQDTVGFNYWLNDNVVFKADIEKLGGAKDDDGFNLGVGYQF